MKATRRLLLGTGLVGSMVLVGWDPWPAGKDEPAISPARLLSVAKPVTSVPAQPERVLRGPITGEVTDLFATTDATSQAAPLDASVPPVPRQRAVRERPLVGPPELPPLPPPTAPPLPYALIGLWTQDAQTAAFLSGPEGTIEVRNNQTLPGGQYRVERIGPDRISLVYLPLNRTQELMWTAGQ